MKDLHDGLVEAHMTAHARRLESCISASMLGGVPLTADGSPLSILLEGGMAASTRSVDWMRDFIADNIFSPAVRPATLVLSLLPLSRVCGLNRLRRRKLMLEALKRCRKWPRHDLTAKT